MSEVITELSQLTAERLNAILHANGHLLEGEVSALHEIGRESFPTSTVFHIDVAYRGYVRLPGRLFLKLINDRDPTLGGREVAFYREVAPAMLERAPLGRVALRAAFRCCLLERDRSRAHSSRGPVAHARIFPSRAAAQRARV